MMETCFGTMQVQISPSSPCSGGMNASTDISSCINSLLESYNQSLEIQLTKGIYFMRNPIFIFQRQNISIRGIFPSDDEDTTWITLDPVWLNKMSDGYDRHFLISIVDSSSITIEHISFSGSGSQLVPQWFISG